MKISKLKFYRASLDSTT